MTTFIDVASRLRGSIRRLAGRMSWRVPAAMLGWIAIAVLAAAQTPTPGTVAPDFTLHTPTGASVQLMQQTGKGPVVLVVLRGYPGYQCPYCVKQVHDFIEHAGEFRAKKATVLFVYPGPGADLDNHAKEALAKQANLPDNIILVTDPDYEVTNRYGLRWDAPHETAYPSTFILDGQGRVIFAKVSRGHGDRMSAHEAAEKLPAK